MDDEQKFIQNLALFLCTYLKEHGQLLEKQPSTEPLLKVGQYSYNRGFFPGFFEIQVVQLQLLILPFGEKHLCKNFNHFGGVLCPVISL